MLWKKGIPMQLKITLILVVYKEVTGVNLDIYAAKIEVFLWSYS